MYLTKLNQTALWVMTAALLLPWFWFTAQMSINGDAAWLLIAAQRWLEGGSLVGEIYETNPPLSIWIHFPPVILSKILNMPLYVSAYGYFFSLLFLSLLAVYSILKRLDFLSHSERFAVFLGFAIGATIIPSVSFAEREHLVLMGLVPFLLVQIAITRNIALPASLTIPVLLAGSLAILLKPHFGIVPAALLAHRFFITGSLRIIYDRDFVILGGTTFLYAALVAVFLPDYAWTILPDVIALYTPEKNLNALPELFLNTALIATFAGVEFAFSQLEKTKKSFLMTLYACALLCLIPYAVQMKGYYYHLIPALGLFFCALALTVESNIAGQFKNLKISSSLVSLVLLFGVAYGARPLLFGYPTHKDYQSLPMTRALNEHCRAPCTYFAFHDSIEILSKTALYSGAVHASRFATFWFLPELLRHPEKHDSLREKYSSYVTEDLKKYEPSVLFILTGLPFQEGGHFDFNDYFSRYTPYAQEMRHYSKAGRLSINRRDYFKGTARDYDDMLEYDIYKRY